MRKQFLKTALMAVAGIGLLAGSALAGPITGGLSMTGSWMPTLNGVASTIQAANGIDFTDNTFHVNTATGDFVSFKGEAGVINDFNFEGTSAIDPLWTLGEYTFVMKNYEELKIALGGAESNQLIVYGTGTITRGGLDDTFGNWSFSGQGIQNKNFSWSASVASDSPAPVPEPGTMLLFGTGLIGLAAVGRRKRVN